MAMKLNAGEALEQSRFDGAFTELPAGRLDDAANLDKCRRGFRSGIQFKARSSSSGARFPSAFTHPKQARPNKRRRQNLNFVRPNGLCRIYPISFCQSEKYKSPDVLASRPPSSLEQSDFIFVFPLISTVSATMRRQVASEVLLPEYETSPSGA
jgi:hypothetical protein